MEITGMTIFRNLLSYSIMTTAPKLFTHSTRIYVVKKKHNQRRETWPKNIMFLISKCYNRHNKFKVLAVYFYIIWIAVRGANIFFNINSHLFRFEFDVLDTELS